MNSLLAEYEQTWQDFRHRTTVQMTVLSVYFATVAGLVYAFAQHREAIEIGVAVGSVGIVLSIGALLLLLGERRAWSADVTRLTVLERVLSGERGVAERRLKRIRCYDWLWTREGYSLSLAGSFAWFLAIVGFTGGLFGGILGFALAEFFSQCPTTSAVLSFFLTVLSLVVVVGFVVWKTRKDSMSKAQELDQECRDGER